MKYVLAIDGGGIRGIIPARVLCYLETQIGRPCYSMFDLIAGTSTGGIIALILAQGYTGDKVAKLYIENGKKIFKKSIWSIIGLTQKKYSNVYLQEELYKYLQDNQLVTSALNVMVTGYDLYHRQPVFIKSWKPQWKDLKCVDAAMMTSAAPTYFEPFNYGRDIGVVDGGVCANNPALSAFVEARKLWPDESITVVSLGTGQHTRKLRYGKVKNWGLVQWAKPILDVVFDGMSDVADYQLEQLLSENNYYRFQIELNGASDDMDNVSYENINCLINEANRLILNNKDRLNTLVSLLK